jgi:hypothetical protein
MLNELSSRRFVRGPNRAHRIALPTIGIRATVKNPTRNMRHRQCSRIAIFQPGPQRQQTANVVRMKMSQNRNRHPTEIDAKLTRIV